MKRAAIGFTVEGRFAMILLATPTPPRPAA